MKDNPSYHVTRLYAGQNIKTGKWSRPYLCGADRQILDKLTDYRGCITGETDTGWGDYADCVIYCIAEMTPSGLQPCQRKVCTAQDLPDYAKALADKELEQEKSLNATDEEILADKWHNGSPACYAGFFISTRTQKLKAIL